VILLAVRPGEEVVQAISLAATDAGITHGAIVSLIGAVDACGISNMPASDARSDIVSEYHQPLEVTGTGEIHDGKAHIHVSLGREGDVALAGHLHWANVETFFVHAYVMRLSNASVPF
jgi:uncharacterized protein